MAMKPSVADVMGKMGSYGSDEPEDPDMDGDVHDEEGPNTEEIDAMKMFERAKTTEQKAEALKTFIKACMPEAY